MTFLDVSEAFSAWSQRIQAHQRCQETVLEAQDSLEKARYHHEQWEGQSDVLTAQDRLEKAHDAEREARREFIRVFREYEVEC